MLWFASQRNLKWIYIYISEWKNGSNNVYSIRLKIELKQLIRAEMLLQKIKRITNIFTIVFWIATPKENRFPIGTSIYRHCAEVKRWTEIDANTGIESKYKMLLSLSCCLFFRLIAGKTDSPSENIINPANWMNL